MVERPGTSLTTAQTECNSEDEPQECTLGSVIGYARVSTDDQNLDLQLDALQRFGCDQIYTDKASGATEERQGYKAMWRDLRAGDTLVVWKLDRIGRSAMGILNAMERIEKLGAKLKVLTQEIDMETAAGRFVVHILAGLAQMERDQGVERTMAGLAAARERGKLGGRRNVLTPDEAAAAVVRLREGETVKGLAKALKVSRSTLYNLLKEANDRE